MRWLIEFLGSSIGKKQLMALTGFCFLAFITVHLAGNLSIVAGPRALDAYADKLASLGPLILVMELGLLFLACVHVGMGLWLFYKNFTARPQRYAVTASAGGKTLSSRTMPYSGLLILTFLVLHLLNFRFADLSAMGLGEIAARIFTNPVYSGFYVVMMVVLGFHVRHGFWSAFQTVGANHPKYMPAIERLAVIFAVIVAAGFGSLPIFVLITG
jgi:succinate dehydrogenase / fumarate reductase cytochrome b subunit